MRRQEPSSQSIIHAKISTLDRAKCNNCVVLPQTKRHPLRDPASVNNLDASTLEAREPIRRTRIKGPKQIPKVRFSQGARKHLDSLGLHGKARKSAKKWHTNIVKSEMKRKGAASAQIKCVTDSRPCRNHLLTSRFRHLAHRVGSADPRLHVTAAFWDKNNKRMKSSYGNPPKRGNLHHVYVGSRPVNRAYRNAVHAAGKTL